jgi:hypothetical protein
VRLDVPTAAAAQPRRPAGRPRGERYQPGRSRCARLGGGGQAGATRNAHHCFHRKGQIPSRSLGCSGGSSGTDFFGEKTEQRRPFPGSRLGHRTALRASSTRLIPRHEQPCLQLPARFTSTRLMSPVAPIPPRRSSRNSRWATRTPRLWWIRPTPWSARTALATMSGTWVGLSCQPPMPRALHVLPLTTYGTNAHHGAQYCVDLRFCAEE